MKKKKPPLFMPASTSGYNRLISFKSLYRAYSRVSRHKKHSKAFCAFEYNLEKNIFFLRKSLRDFTYRSSCMKRLLIPGKSSRKPIYCPCIKDRIVQQALKAAIYPVFSKSFIHDSYAFRIGKGTHSAIRRFDSFKRKAASRTSLGTGYILKMDIKEYYPSINHRVLLSILAGKIDDKRTIWLIKDFLRISPNKTFNAFGPKGIPIGSPLSQALANIYLNELDYFIKHSLGFKHYIRFADDFILLDKKSLVHTKAMISDYLRYCLLLTPHPQKSVLTTIDKGINLLGYKIFYFHKRIKNQNLEKFKERLISLQRDYSLGLMGQEKLTQKIRGWCEYARYADSYNLRKKLFEKHVFIRKTKQMPRL